MYRMALTTSRRECSTSCGPHSLARTKGSMRAHCASVRSERYGFLSGMEMSLMHLEVMTRGGGLNLRGQVPGPTFKEGNQGGATRASLTTMATRAHPAQADAAGTGAHGAGAERLATHKLAPHQLRVCLMTSVALKEN